MTGKRISIDDKNAPLDGVHYLNESRKFTKGVKDRVISGFSRDR